MAANDIVIDDEALEAEYDKAVGAAADSQNPWPAMTYIEGVRDTLAWLRGDREEAPLEDLDE